MPNSDSSARSALPSWVRWLTSRSRLRCSDKAACWSTVLIGTNRMSGRPTASQHAAASIASLLLRFT
jgi:hypothetical protein